MNTVTAYQILGIPQNSDLAIIRSAYKKKAKTSHPDLNKSPNAHEEFIQVNEAYEMLVKIKTGKIVNPKTNQFRKPPKKTSKEWTPKESELARRRAEEIAKLQYWRRHEIIYAKAVFKLTDLYPKTVLSFGIAVGALITIVLPILMVSIVGWTSLIGYLLILIVTFPFLRSLYAAIKD